MDIKGSGTDKDEDLTDNYYACSFKKIYEGKQKSEDFDWLSFRNMCLTFMVLDDIGDRVSLIDKDFNIVLCNQTYYDYYRKNNSGVVGKKCYFVEYGRDKPCFEDDLECSVRRVLQTGKNNLRLEYSTDKEGNQIVNEVKTYPIKDNQGNTLLVLFAEKDVTESKRLERELEDKVQELQEFYDMAVGRELRMIELREEMDKLKLELGEYKKR
ncbi:MAG: hypothetical protein DDT40_00948 [candidate division WS2 bacterium]|uniref:PAC domain-containing protein n=1 Tax=Psychracetigena formicireducens TaxID=2986056 RepID=A0A9E2F4V3_PSYF1|nr:hypothetical protein [Candidatus Psychracetigena formicireducens]MBT9145466.1 hypothetical protein [Candidatus Psychracetigena formicireducens]MBT9150769.1 hypothetical protein [Candidatus Psychracetigena formicireducens]